jgi:ribosome-associated translation inhibitor RaiA
MPRQTDILPPVVPRASKRHAGRTAADATPLYIRGHHVDVDESLERYVRERTSRKLAKFAHDEQRITVRFEDLNGPKGGLSIACRIEILVPAAPTIVIEDRAARPRDAFDLAVDEAARALAHSLEKRQRSQGKPARGKKDVATLDAAAREEAFRAVATDEEAQKRPPRHELARPSRATAALETSASGKASRKSTRKSANRAKQGTELGHREINAVTSPAQRAERGKRGAGD